MSEQKRLTNLDYNNPGYWQDEQRQLPSASRTAGQPVMVRPLDYGNPAVARRMVEPIDINMPQQAVMSVDMRTTAVDRAQGFSIETHQLSMVVGALAVLIGVFGFGHPFLTLGTLFTFGIWYTVVWLAAWVLHRVISPEGIAAFNAVMSWVYIFRRG